MLLLEDVMKKIVALSLLPLMAGCMEQRPMEMSARAQTELAAALEGRSAGAPQSCVPSRDLRGNRSAGEGAIIFDSPSRNLIYVNRPAGGCPELRMGDALKTRTTSTRLCAGDIVQVFDPVTGFSSGSCGLGDFTPYRRLR
jgi:hypothetical protein